MRPEYLECRSRTAGCHQINDSRFVLEPEDRGRVFEELLTFGYILWIVVVKIQTVLSVEICVEGNIVVPWNSSDRTLDRKGKHTRNNYLRLKIGLLDPFQRLLQLLEASLVGQIPGVYQNVALWQLECAG